MLARFAVASCVLVFASAEAAGDGGHHCREDELDGRGNCPAKPEAPKAPTAHAPTAKAPPPAPQAPNGCPVGMAHVVAGTFSMGGKTGGKDAIPAHDVTLSGFCIDRTEVTLGDYRRCVTAGSCTAGGARGGGDFAGCNRGVANRDAHPVNCIDWDQATAFCAWANKRLPTEAEWEYAARGSDGRLYPWGNTKPTSEKLNWNRDDRETMPVGSFPKGASAFGALDMAGNVWEWVADWSGPYEAEAQTDPGGAKSGTSRVIRGGAQNANDEYFVRATLRNSHGPADRSDGIGFRCARAE